MHCFFMRAGHIADLSMSMTGLSDQDAIAKAHLLFLERLRRFRGLGSRAHGHQASRPLRREALRPVSRGYKRGRVRRHRIAIARRTADGRQRPEQSGSWSCLFSAYCRPSPTRLPRGRIA